jgi:hypothetical protein
MKERFIKFIFSHIAKINKRVMKTKAVKDTFKIVSSNFDNK